MQHYNNWEEFMKKVDGRLFRMYVYNKVKNERRIGRESLFDNVELRFVFIRESVVLPNGEVLLGVQEIGRDGYTDEFFQECCPIQYYQLSDIWLVYVPVDAEMFNFR